MIATAFLRWVNRTTQKDGRVTGQNVLQQWHQAEAFDHADYQVEGGQWRDVKLEEEKPAKRNPQSNYDAPLIAKLATLLTRGYGLMLRDPKVRAAFPGDFMVKDLEDNDDQAYCIVGDDCAELIEEAYFATHI